MAGVICGSSVRSCYKSGGLSIIIYHLEGESRLKDETKGSLAPCRSGFSSLLRQKLKWSWRSLNTICSEK